MTIRFLVRLEGLLMDDSYNDLRKVIYTTDAEVRRFRALVVISVISRKYPTWTSSERENSTGKTDIGIKTPLPKVEPKQDNVQRVFLLD